MDPHASGVRPGTLALVGHSNAVPARQWNPVPARRPPGAYQRQYARAFEETKTLGSSTAPRTQEQSDVPRFWLPAGTQGWNSAARQVAAAAGTSLSENARIFALLNMGGADAIIACWDTKFAYNFWRPVTAIRGADTDGNAATDADPTWSSFVVTPPFPEYVSGHACFAGAAKYVLERFFGHAGDKNITLVSSTLPGVSRTYTSFRQIADEIDNARVWGGIHFRFSQDLGRRLGKNVGRFGAIHYLLPVRRQDDANDGDGDQSARLLAGRAPVRTHATWVPHRASPRVALNQEGCAS